MFTDDMTSVDRAFETFRPYVEFAQQKYSLPSNGGIRVDNRCAPQEAVLGVWVPAWLWVHARDVTGLGVASTDLTVLTTKQIRE